MNGAEYVRMDYLLCHDSYYRGYFSHIVHFQKIILCFILLPVPLFVVQEVYQNKDPNFFCSSRELLHEISEVHTIYKAHRSSLRI